MRFFVALKQEQNRKDPFGINAEGDAMLDYRLISIGILYSF